MVLWSRALYHTHVPACMCALTLAAVVRTHALASTRWPGRIAAVVMLMRVLALAQIMIMGADHHGKC